MKNFSIFVIISIVLMLLSVPSTFTFYALSTEKEIQPEDIDDVRTWSLLNSTKLHVDQTSKAIEDGNSAEALRLLTVIRKDLTDINGNVTDLIFSVSNIPP